MKIAEEEKDLIKGKNQELERLYIELRQTTALKEKISKKIKNYKIFENFMKTVFNRTLLI
jgi:hypothetical protein